MKRKTIALYPFIATILFIAGSIYFYEYRKMELEQKVKDTFVEVLKKELEKRIPHEDRDYLFSFGELLDENEAPKPVTIWYPDGEKRSHKIDPKKHWKNIVMDSKTRSFHSCAFEIKALVPDTINAVWQEDLKKEDLKCQTGIRMYITDRDEKVTTTSTSDSEWCKTPFWLCTVGYRCEFTFIIYINYSIWQLIRVNGILYALAYLLCVWSIYKWSVIVRKRMNSKEIIIEKEIVKEVVKEVPIQILDSTEVKLYQLTDNAIYNVQERKLIIKGQLEVLPPQTAILFELFLKAENNTLLVETIEKKLWVDGSGNGERVRQAIARLRKVLEVVPTLSIERLSMGIYQFTVKK